jgi:hypothetical protein
VRNAPEHSGPRQPKKHRVRAVHKVAARRSCSSGEQVHNLGGPKHDRNAEDDLTSPKIA